MPFSIIPFLLLAIPLAEIAAFILIGGQIGVFPTLGIVFLTAIIGSILLRIQGFGLINRIQTESRAGRIPGRELIHGVMILIAGVLLLTPGFVTDTLGFLLFVPPIRDAGWKLVKNRVNIVSPADLGAQKPNRTNDPDVVELDENEFAREPNPDSPWSDGEAPNK